MKKTDKDTVIKLKDDENALVIDNDGEVRNVYISKLVLSGGDVPAGAVMAAALAFAISNQDARINAIVRDFEESAQGDGQDTLN